MKRVPELRDLSEDHHHGLMLARKAKIAAESCEGSPTVAEVWTEVERQFCVKLEPHFQIEETLIASALDDKGESTLTRRLYTEHAVLRGYVMPASERTGRHLRIFGELLEEHIRFEEREVFEVAQERLNVDELQAVARACRAARVQE